MNTGPRHADAHLAATDRLTATTAAEGVGEAPGVRGSETVRGLVRSTHGPGSTGAGRVFSTREGA
jgi:hypothetical protein